MKYDYREAMVSDIIEYIRDGFTADELNEKMEDRDEFAQELNDELWTVDSVTGNGSGSYTFDRWQAEEYLMHNLDLLADAVDEFGGNTDVLRDGPEACDVTIRCYLLGECLEAALDKLEANGYED